MPCVWYRFEELTTVPTHTHTKHDTDGFLIYPIPNIPVEYYAEQKPVDEKKICQIENGMWDDMAMKQINLDKQ